MVWATASPIGDGHECVSLCVCPLNIYAYTNINSTMIRIISYLFRQNRMLISLDSDKNCTKKSNHGDWHPGFFTPCHLHFVTKFRKNEKPITFIDLLTLFSFLGYFRLSTGHDPTCTKLVSPSSQLPLQAAAAASTNAKRRQRASLR